MTNVVAPITTQSVTLVPAATITMPDGSKANAKDILCAEAPSVITGLQAGAALMNNPIVKNLILWLVIPAIQMLVAEFCPAK